MQVSVTCAESEEDAIAVKPSQEAGTLGPSELLNSTFTPRLHFDSELTLKLCTSNLISLNYFEVALSLLFSLLVKT